ncbi:MAG: hypothetical protein WCS92_04835 [Candidatus Babeliales bacterium]|jgi:hypothetical protein
MVSIFKKSLLALGFAFASFAIVSARTVSECRTQLKEIAQSLVEQNVYNPKIASFARESVILQEEEIIEFCDQLLLYQKDLGSKANGVENIKNELISYLRSFVASGMDVGEIDPNFAFIYDEQNPNFIVTFKNAAGEAKTRKYALKIWSIGAKFEFAIRVEGIAILGSDFNYYDSIGKEYNLGSGIDFGLYPKFDESDISLNERRNWLRCHGIPKNHPFLGRFYNRQKVKLGIGSWGFGICFMTSKITGTASNLVIAGIAFGLGGSFTDTGLELSYVYGGKMTPIKE